MLTTAAATEPTELAAGVSFAVDIDINNHEHDDDDDDDEHDKGRIPAAARRFHEYDDYFARCTIFPTKPEVQCHAGYAACYAEFAR